MGMIQPPFHADELAAQARAGQGASGAVRDFMPDQHREFFAMLPAVFLGAGDATGWPVATMLTGAPGFVAAPDAQTLRVAAHPSPADPAAPGIAAGREVGLLGIDLATRRRNRANGRVTARDAAGFTLAVRQSFGNCPQYIQRREIVASAPEAETIGSLAGLDAEARHLITRADTLFVASRARDALGPDAGSDISHRGGRPGFVRAAGDRLSVPEFAGNRYFNTLGNLLGEPRAGLLFLDFDTGTMLQLQGRVTIDWNPPAEVAGAERVWHFEVLRGWRRRNASGLRWSFRDYARQLERTGVWPENAPHSRIRGSDASPGARPGIAARGSASA